MSVTLCVVTVSFLADRTAKQYMIGYWQNPVVRLSVYLYNAVHCGSRDRCTELKVVPACSQQASSYLSLQTLLLYRVYRLATKLTEQRIEENASGSFFRRTIRRTLMVGCLTFCYSLTS